MGVIGFHRFLISAAILFCFGFGIWELLHYADTSAPASLVTAIVFFILGGALGYYLLNLQRFLRGRHD